jgi:hypothetical protein
VKFRVLQAKGQDIAYLYYYLLLGHSPVNTRLHYALNYTMNVIYCVPRIPPTVTQQPQRIDMMGKKTGETKRFCINNKHETMVTNNTQTVVQFKQVLLMNDSRILNLLRHAYVHTGRSIF